LSKNTRIVLALLVLATPSIGPPPNVCPLVPELELGDDDPGPVEAPSVSVELPEEELPEEGLLEEELPEEELPESPLAEAGVVAPVC
jgi:hypothetical protein